VQSQVWLFAAILSPGKSVVHHLLKSANGAPKRKAYLHVIQTSGYNDGKATGNLLKVNGDLYLSEGDGAFAQGPDGEAITIENVGDGDAEVLVFDLD
jgi:hypothetical protein